MKNSVNIFRGLCLAAILSVALAAVSCNPNDHITRIVLPDSIIDLDIATIRSFYHGQDVRIDKDNHFKQINIYGSVISDPESGNTPKGYLILQQDNTGISLVLDDSTGSIDYTPNEVMQVNVREGTLTEIDGNLVITGLSGLDVTPTGEVDSIIPRSVSLKDLAGSFDNYDETLIRVNLADIVPVPAPGDTYAGEKGLDDGSTLPGLIKLYTFPGSALASKKVSLNSTYTGIAMYKSISKDSLAKQIWLRNENDIDSTRVYPVNAPFVISGFLANPNGWDQINPGIGYFPSYLDRPVEGGFEYVQFMALQDIDFSKTPYSAVLMVGYEGRPGATADGWTAGEFRTAKFNLTSGTAAAGTFFYVGSGEKLIDGFSPEGFSTDISNANWIRSTPWWFHDYDDEIGDPFSNGNIGHGLHSWLDDRTDAGSDAIAVFKGTTVAPSSVPVDAVFLNEKIGGSLDQAHGYGFLVPDNDLYSAVDPDTDTPQPLFGEGTNTYAVPISLLSKENTWVALGGIVGKSGFIVKRNQPTGIMLYKDPGKSQLSDIEQGNGIMVFRK